jgi:hypothetical protein
MDRTEIMEDMTKAEHSRLPFSRIIPREDYKNDL